jgi:hypothetical protein
MWDQSFSVHLQSLTDFARELQTQLDGMGGPMDQLTQLAGAPVLLGEFAENVTRTVATGYERLDDDLASGMQVTTGYADSQGDSTWT